MKTYWDHTNKERAEMTREQVEQLINFELMEKGVVRPTPPVLEPIEESPIGGRKQFYSLKTKGKYGSDDFLGLCFETSGMKPLLAILSYVRANEIVARHWPWYQKAGCDILGVGRETTSCEWPVNVGCGGLVNVTNIGEDSYVHGDNLIRLHVDTLDYMLSLVGDYTHFCLIEPDTIFVRKIGIQDVPQYGLRATLVGQGSPGFYGRFYCHGPWFFDRHGAQFAINSARRMLDVGLIEKGFPDRFWGLLCDLSGLPFTKLHAYSQNRLDRPEYIQQARQAIAEGALAVHGIKTESELRSVVE